MKASKLQLVGIPLIGTLVGGGLVYMLTLRSGTPENDTANQPT